MPIRSLAFGPLLGISVFAAAQAAPPPPEHYARGAAISNVAISPSGQRLALLTTSDRGRRVAAVINLAPLSAMKVVASFSDGDVNWVRWVNDDRLVLAAAQGAAVLDREDMAGTFAVDHDGQGLRQLIAYRTVMPSTGTHVVSRVLTYEWSVHNTIDDGSADILVERAIWDGHGDRVDDRPARLNTVTGELTRLGRGMPSGSSGWVFDRRHEPRVVSVFRDGRQKIYWRQAADGEWQQIEDFSWFANDGFVPRYLESDEQLVVEAHNGRDTSALYTYDLRARKLAGEPLLALGRFDLDAQLETDSRTQRVVGVHTRADQPLSA